MTSMLCKRAVAVTPCKNEIEQDREALDLEECRHSTTKTRDYRYVSEADKEKLIRLVSQGRFTISKAAKIANVNYSTAKHIVLRYKKSAKKINSNGANCKREELQLMPKGFGPSSLFTSQNCGQAIKKFADASCQTDALQGRVQNGGACSSQDDGNLRKLNHPSCKCGPMGQRKERGGGGGGQRILKKRDLGKVQSSQVSGIDDCGTFKRQKLSETSEFTMVLKIRDGESKEKDQIDGEEPIHQSQGVDGCQDCAQQKNCRDLTTQIIDSGKENAIMQKDEKDIQCGQKNESISQALINGTENMHQSNNLNSPLNLESIQQYKDNDRTNKKVRTTRCLVTIDLQDFDQMQMVNFKIQRNAHEPKEDDDRHQDRPHMPTVNQLDQQYKNIHLQKSASASSAASDSGFQDAASLQISRRLHLVDPEVVGKCVLKGPAAVAAVQGKLLLPLNTDPAQQQQVSSLQNLTRQLQQNPPAVRSAGALHYKRFSLFDHYSRLNEDA